MPAHRTTPVPLSDAVRVGSTVEIADPEGHLYRLRVESVTELAPNRFRVVGVVRSPRRYRARLATGVTDARGRPAGPAPGG